MAEVLPEPWLRGVLPNAHPVIGHLLRASQQIVEDMHRTLANRTPEQLWATPYGLTSAGFHAKHLAGSTQRLLTYFEGRQLTGDEAAAIAREGAGADSAPELMAAIQAAFTRYDGLIRELDPQDFGIIREIGRKRLQTTAISLAIHIAEHGQRHVGQAISAVKLALA